VELPAGNADRRDARAIRRARMDAPILSLSSHRSSEFSPDTTSQRQSHQHSSSRQQQHHSLSSSIPVEYDSKDGNASGRMARAMNTMRRIATSKRRRSIRSFSPGVRFEPQTLPSAVSVNGGATTKKKKTTTTTNKRQKDKLTKVDLAIVVTYFCNIFVVTLTVVTVPAIALEHGLGSQSVAAFCASMAGIATMGGFLGKLVNGFVCQRLGGHRSSVVYLAGLSMMSLAMSFSRSLAPIGLCLFGFEFLSSIQWVAISSVLHQHYQKIPRLRSRGITLLSIASTVGALSSKTFGSILLRTTNWRKISRIGAAAALLGATAMYLGGGGAGSSSRSFGRGNDGSALGRATRVSAGGQQIQSPLASLKSVLGNPVFWMVGLGHSLGHLSRISDRLLGPFLQDVGGISGPMAIGLTSSVTLGFILGIFRVKSFRKMKSVNEKMNLIRKSYVASVLSTMGLAACGVDGLSTLLGGGGSAIIAAITIFSGIIASSVSFQFYQIPAMVSSTMFPESASVALSLTDAIGFFATSVIMGLNSIVLGNFGWSASWTFMAVVFTLGGVSMTRALRPVLVESMKTVHR